MVKVLYLFLVYVHLWSWWKVNIFVLQPAPDPWASVHAYLKKDQERKLTKHAMVNSSWGREQEHCLQQEAWGSPPEDVKFWAALGPPGPQQMGEAWESE